MRAPDWTEEEITLALRAYLDCRRPRGDGKYVYRGNPALCSRVADEINRTVWNGEEVRSRNSVKAKLDNLTHLDHEDMNVTAVGRSHGSAADRKVWDRYMRPPDGRDRLYEDTHGILSRYCAVMGERLGGAPAVGEMDLDSEDAEGTAVAEIRMAMGAYRDLIVGNYSGRCCVTGISGPGLLDAVPIKPWNGSSPRERMDPSNALCLGPTMGRLFSVGLMAVDPDDLRVCYAPGIETIVGGDLYELRLSPYSGKKIATPKRDAPGKEYLEHHYAKASKDWIEARTIRNRTRPLPGAGPRPADRLSAARECLGWYTTFRRPVSGCTSTDASTP